MYAEAVLYLMTFVTAGELGLRLSRGAIYTEAEVVEQVEEIGRKTEEDENVLVPWKNLARNLCE